jgi:hypothetical protein
MAAAGQLHTLLAPGGLLAIGTPNASAIDLRNPEKYVHTLHQPYHRHILSKTALLRLGISFAWSLLRYHGSSYVNTRIPFINVRFLLHYLTCRDRTFDAAFEPVQPSLRMISPRGLFLGFFGSLFAPETDVMVMYRYPFTGSGLQAPAEIRSDGQVAPALRCSRG